MINVCACLLVLGHAHYFRAGRLAARSVLRHSDFDLFAAVGEGPGLGLPATARVRIHAIDDAAGPGGRAGPFLLKFRALQACLAATDADVVLLLDADAMLVTRIERARVDAALEGRALGMVEQTGIRGAGVTREGLRRHYIDHTLAWFAPGTPTPRPEDFRYFNSGVVLARRAELEGLVSWALDAIAARTARAHQIGEHMIADQDYFQFWANSLHPGRCATLPWAWNHCEHWDADFPHPDALIVHFSNFCRGPGPRQLLRMRAMAGWPALFRSVRRARTRLRGAPAG